MWVKASPVISASMIRGDPFLIKSKWGKVNHIVQGGRNDTFDQKLPSASPIECLSQEPSSLCLASLREAEQILAKDPWIYCLSFCLRTEREIDFSALPCKVLLLCCDPMHHLTFKGKCGTLCLTPDKKIFALPWWHWYLPKTLGYFLDENAPNPKLPSFVAMTALLK